MEKNSRIYVAGHRGLVGSAILRKLQSENYQQIITRDSSLVDLTRQTDTEHFFSEEKPEYVFLAAAKVGGIWANDAYPAEFIYQNLMIQSNVIHAAYQTGVKKLLFLGSACIYPKLAPQPMKEDCLLTSELEPTNEPYAIAKIAGAKMCHSYNRQYGTNFVAVMPNNIYGPNDNFDLKTSHVLPAMLRKIHEAKTSGAPLVLWGTGIPRREFLHVDDLADACLFIMQNYDENELINIGTGKDISIGEVAKLIKEIIGYQDEIHWDKSQPDGTPQKLLDISKLTKLGWKAKIPLQKGLQQTYCWYRESLSSRQPR